MTLVQTERSAATSAGGMITSPHRLATEAGARVLRRGGNAVEAVVAAGAALSVVYPHFCGLGGDAVWLVADHTGNAKAVLGIGQSAADLPDMPTIPLRGAGSTLTTACLVDSWDKVLGYSAENWDGRETLGTLLDDAIRLAEAGFEVSRSQAFWHRFRQQEIDGWPGFADHFASEGIQRQPQLAATLKAIAANGGREFYEGALAQSIAEGLAAADSPLTKADLAATRARIEDPISLPYRDMLLLAPPPPTQGMTTLEIIGVLSHFPMADFAPGTAGFFHRIVEAVKQAFLDRGAIADPDFNEVNIGHLLDPGRLATKAHAIDPASALAWPQTFKPGDTAFLAATDAEGRSASMLQSIYFDWGSGVVVGDTGILWQNRGAAFSLDPESPNRLEPGKRPFYTLNPCMALRGGRPHLLYGTQGADGQPQTLALLLSLLIDHGLDPLQALSQPRFLLGRTFSDSRDSLKIEANVGTAAIDALADLGHEVAVIDAFSQIAGQAGVIRIHPDGQIDGAHDPRSDGMAMGL